MSNIVKHELPKLADLVQDTEMSLKDNALTVLLNQEPPQKWIAYHPTVKVDKIIDGVKVKVPLPYLPIERVEWLLVSIYGKWKSKINTVTHIANSIVVTVTVTVTNPITGLEECHDGIGSAPLQTDAGKSAVDWNFIKSNAVQIGAPAAESYAIKDACEKYGKIFGRDLSRKDAIGYESLLKQKDEYDWAMLTELFKTKAHLIDSNDERSAMYYAISSKEKTSYHKILNYLNSL